MGAASRNWLERARRLAAAHTGRIHRGDTQLRLSLAELWRLVDDCPVTDLAIAFRSIPDNLLEVGAQSKLPDLEAGQLSWSVAGSIGQTAGALGVAMRALDHALKGGSDFGSLSSGAASYIVPAADCYVIPRLHPKVFDEKKAARGPGRGLGRRATPHHRIIPCEVDGKKVEIIIDPSVTGLATGRGTTCGAGFIPGMALEPKPVTGPWRGSGSPTDRDDLEILARQVTAAFSKPMLGAMWPELSMFPERRAHLEWALCASAAYAEDGKGPVFVAAGSAHVEKAGAVMNEMRVLDRFGRTLATYDKLRAYVRKVEEDIVTGDRFVVLATEEWLVTFAICLDFCDMDVASSFLELDVDCIFVSSLANLATMKGHENNASTHGTRYGSAAFVVQQNEENGGPLGFVYPSSANRSVYEVNTDWTTRRLKFSARSSSGGQK